MKYAIPVSNGVMAQHFGYCEQFALIDVDEEKRTIVNKEIVPSPGHQPGLLPAWLAEQGASVIIAGGMGSRAQDLFQQSHIKTVVNTLESDPEKAVLSYLSGILTTGDSICDH